MSFLVDGGVARPQVIQGFQLISTWQEWSVATQLRLQTLMMACELEPSKAKASYRRCNPQSCVPNRKQSGATCNLPATDLSYYRYSLHTYVYKSFGAKKAWVPFQLAGFQLRRSYAPERALVAVERVANFWCAMRRCLIPIWHKS